MSQSPNQRAVCGVPQGTTKIYFGDCATQCLPSPVAIKTNTTKYKSYVDGTWVDPYATVANPFTQPDCSPYYDYTCGDGVNGKVYCHADLPSDLVQSHDTAFTVGTKTNTYLQTTETASNCSNCNTRGYKTVYASKAHQGRYGYTSKMNHMPGDYTWCGGCQVEEVNATPDPTRYRTVTATVDWEVESLVVSTTPVGDPYFFGCRTAAPCAPCTIGSEDCAAQDGQCFETTYTAKSWGGAASSYQTVDIYGNVTGTTTSSSYGVNDYAGCDSDPDCLAYYTNELAAYAAGGLNEANTTNHALLTYLGTLSAPTTVVRDGVGAWTLTWTATESYWCTDGCGCLLDEGGNWTRQVVVITPTSFDKKIWKLTTAAQYEEGEHCTDDGYCRSVFLTYHESLTFSNTSYTHQTETWPGYDAAHGYTRYTVTGVLSDPYTVTDVKTALTTLLAEWDLGDDDEYPWRTDTAITLGPYVTYNEIPGTPQVPHLTNISGYGSTIQGSPGPVGIDRIWITDHPNYCVCTTLLECSIFYLKDYGAWSTVCGVPRATKMVDYYLGNMIPAKAFAGQGFFWTTPSSCNESGPTQQINDPYIYAAKYAELIYKKPSYNFARPCGSDTFAPSGSISYCVTTASLGVLTLDPLGPALLPFTSSQRLLVTGVSGSADGIYLGTRTGDYTATLGNTLYSASWIPPHLWPAGGNGTITLCRWGSLTPGICGKIDIINVTQANTNSFCEVEYESNRNGYLFAGDLVQITDVIGTNINGTWSVIPTGSNKILLVNSSGSRGNYTGSGLIRSVNSVDWQWDDNKSKNDFISKTWTHDYRSLGEWTRVSASYVWNSGLGQCCEPSPVSGCDCEQPEGVCDCYKPTVPEEPYLSQKNCVGQTIVSSSCETECVSYSACGAVVYYSPNTENFKFGSINLGFTIPDIDTDYSSMWQGAVQQAMADPLFQAPPCPCACEDSWAEDNGSGQGDTSGIKYYAGRPMYEARSIVPTGAPELPTSVPELGYVSTAQGGTCSWRRSAATPPQPYSDYPITNNCAPYLPYGYDEPWHTHEAKETNVCAEGRFHENYEDNGISCPDVVPPP
jgi:hypothetical protein